jgi:hypothetical protein
MTLVVATAETTCIWMVSDTAISDPRVSLRERHYQPKVESSTDQRVLIGFAGNDAENGARLTAIARTYPAGRCGLDVLVQGSGAHPNVEFAYAFFDNGIPLLFRVSQGASEQLTTFHLGSTPAFDTFQRIRHGELEPYAPKALKTFIAAAKGETSVPDGLSTAIRSMIDLFAATSEQGVGGWAVPYILTSEGGYFCTYAYGVSDPIFNTLLPGSVVPHGTSQEGGANLSVTELPDKNGIVAYWLQLPGGMVLRRLEDGSYEQRLLRGSPTEFKKLVQAVIGQTPDLWIGDQPAGPIRSLNIMRGADGTTNMVMADHGDALTFAVHNVATPFHSKATMQLGQTKMGNERHSDRGSRLSAEMSADKRSVVLSASDGPSAQITLDAQEIDVLILQLGSIRAQMLDPLPTALVSGTQTLVALDPIWRTERSPHPGLEGILMTLRHNGLGWLGFLLPDHEARSMGGWLVENTLPPAG